MLHNLDDFGNGVRTRWDCGAVLVRSATVNGTPAPFTLTQGAVIFNTAPAAGSLVDIQFYRELQSVPTETIQEETEALVFVRADNTVASTVTLRESRRGVTTERLLRYNAAGELLELTVPTVI